MTTFCSLNRAQTLTPRGFEHCLDSEDAVISNEATVGIYNFTHGVDYVKYAEKMISKDIRVNGEFYVAPVYNELIADGGRVLYHNVGAVENGMYGLGTPEDLKIFLENKVSLKIKETG